MKKPASSLLSMFKPYLGEPHKNKPPKAASESGLKEINGLVGLVEWPDEMFNKQKP